jgi:tetratricopeptide (TPR) repeat protein
MTLNSHRAWFTVARVPGQCKRVVSRSALIVAIVTTTVAGQTPAADPLPTYRAAVAAYARTGDISRAVLPLQDWPGEMFEAAIKAMVARTDPQELQDAAVFHLEIGVALAGVATAVAAGHINYGSGLLDRWTAARPMLKPKQGEDEKAFRSKWFGVAGSAFLAVKDFNRARPLLNKANAALPRSASVQTLLGTLQEFEGFMYSPGSAPTLSRRSGNQRERTVRYYQAERLYRQALRFDPDYALAHVRLGHVLHWLGKPQEGRASLERGRQIAKDPQARYLAALFFGLLQQDENDVAAARQSFEQAAAIAPTSQPPVVALAYLEVMAGRPDRANAVTRRLAEAVDGEPWWAFHHGGLDLTGLRWLRERVME